MSDDFRAVVAGGLRLSVGMMWLVAASAKTRHPQPTRDAVHELLGGPAGLATILVGLLLATEAGLGMLLLAGVGVRPAAAASATLLVVFAVLLGKTVVTNSLGAGGCGCFGMQRNGPARDSSAAIRAAARNLVLASMAVAVAVHG